MWCSMNSKVVQIAYSGAGKVSSEKEMLAIGTVVTN